MADAWSIRRVLDWSARDFGERGLLSPRLDAEILVARALGVTRVGLYLDLDRPLDPEELSVIREFVRRRRSREPIAYIVGERDFWKRTFVVSRSVLVPRPDTETLVAAALERLPRDAPFRVLDLCTGSGALAVTLALERPLSVVVATDVSADALEVARRNVTLHGVERQVTLVQGDLFAAVEGAPPFDMVVSNPPYIPRADLDSLDADVRDYEPKLALYGGEDGFDFHRRIVRDVPAFLAKSGWLLVEVGAGQSAGMRELLSDAGGFEEVGASLDYGEVERVVFARLRSQA